MRFTCGVAFVCVCTAGCFPTLQSPRIDPGFHIDAGATFIGDQRRNGREQGSDYLGYIGPSYGFGDRVEIGLPVAVYLEEGLESLDGEWQFGTSPREVGVLPYIKVALLSPASRDRLAFTLQSVLILPANAGIVWGRDLGKVEPVVGVSVIFSAGPAGDDPLVTRYQEADQYLISVYGGAEIDAPGRPAIVIGVLRNHYSEGAVFGDFGQPKTGRTFWDVHLGLRFRLF